MANQSEKSRRGGRFWSVIIAIGVLLLCFALAPSFLSTRVGTSLLGQMISHQHGGLIQCKSASFSWGRHQEIVGLRWTRGGAILTVDRITSNLSLWSLLWGGHNLGEITVDHPSLQIAAPPPQLEQSSKGSATQKQTNRQPTLPFHSRYYGQASTTNGELSVAASGGEETNLSNLSLSVAIPASRDLLTLLLEGKAVSAQLYAGQNLAIQLKTDQLPLSSLEGILSLVSDLPSYLLTALLGETVTLSLNANATEIALQATAPLLTANIRGTIKDGAFSLAQPGAVSGLLTSQAFHELTQPNGTFQLAGPTRYQFTAQELTLPLSHWRNSVGRAELTVSTATLTSINQNQVTISSIKGAAQRSRASDPLQFTLSAPLVDSGRSGQVALSGAIQSPNSQMRLEMKRVPTGWIYTLFPDWKLAPLLGSRLDGFLAAQGSCEKAIVTLALQTDTLQLNPVELGITPQQIDLNSFAIITLALPDATAQKVFPHLLHIDPISLNLSALSISCPFRWTLSTAQGELACPLLTLSNGLKGGLLDVEKIRIKMEGESLAEAQLSAVSTLSLRRLPSFWTEWIGDELTLSLYGLGYKGNRTVDFDLLTSSQGLSCNTRATLTSQGVLQINSPVEILSTPPVLGGAEFKSQLSPFSVNLLSPSLKELNVEITTALKRPHNGLNRFNADVIWRGPKNVALLDFDGLTEEASPFNGKMKLSGHFSGNQLRWKPASFCGKIDLTDFPTAAIAGLSDRRRKQLNALFGEELSLCSSWSIAQFYGPLSLSLQSSRSQMRLDGKLDDGVLTLAQPLHAEVVITPYLSGWLLGKINPLLANAISSDRPLSLNVAANNFSLPLLPYNPSRINVPSATIDFGKVLLANRGGVDSLIRLAQPSLEQQPAVPAWFTPLPISVSLGQMELSRMDALIGEGLHIATWGKIDLVSHRVRLMLAIAPDTMSQLAGEAEPEYFLIPISGEMGSTSINWPLAATQLASLVAKRSGGRTATVGKVLDIVTGVKKQRERVPAEPTLPWKDSKPDLLPLNLAH
jgi:hypothetical protein